MLNFGKELKKLKELYYYNPKLPLIKVITI
jgi:hypothetical protein